jgi:prepilin-type N-terminal cleavage/methylation domain-containing protein
MERRGFTLIELLVVIAIIGLMATVSVVAFSGAAKKGRDAKRLFDMRQIMTALDLYFDKYGVYPGNTDADWGGYDEGCAGGPNSGDPFLQPLQDSGFIKKVCDPNGTNQDTDYLYYLYPAGGWGACDAARGDFYILAVTHFESIVGEHPSNPRFKCAGRDWTNEYPLKAWVTGKYSGDN